MKRTVQASHRRVARRRVKAPAPVCLVTDDRMAGRFVALRSLMDREIVASGRDAVKVIAAARGKGVESPLVLFVPKEEVICMY